MAFYIIAHGILLGQLWELGVSGTVLCWFSSFYWAQLQSVLREEKGSNLCPLLCGMPSIFSPLLFKIYMMMFLWFGVRYHQYVDDTQLYVSEPSPLRDAVDILFQYLEDVQVWMGQNGL